MAASKKHEETLAKRRIESFFAPQQEEMERRKRAMLGVAEAAQDYISARNRLGAETRKFSDAIGRDIPRGQLAEVVGVSRKELDTVVTLAKKDDGMDDPDGGQDKESSSKDEKKSDDASDGQADVDRQPENGQDNPGFGVTGY